MSPAHTAKHTDKQQQQKNHFVLHPVLVNGSRALHVKGSIYTAV